MPSNPRHDYCTNEHLDPITFVRELDSYYLEIWHVQKWASYVKALESYHLTDIQIDGQLTYVTQVPVM